MILQTQQAATHADIAGNRMEAAYVWPEAMVACKAGTFAPAMWQKTLPGRGIHVLLLLLSLFPPPWPPIPTGVL